MNAKRKAAIAPVIVRRTKAAKTERVFTDEQAEAAVRAYASRRLKYRGFVDDESKEFSIVAIRKNLNEDLMDVQRALRALDKITARGVMESVSSYHTNPPDALESLAVALDEIATEAKEKSIDEKYWNDALSEIGRLMVYEDKGITAAHGIERAISLANKLKPVVEERIATRKAVGQ